LGWNHNLHYHDALLAAAPAGCESALDVGCGEGVFARRLRQSIPRVTGIDVDADSIALARRRDQRAEIEYRVGDFLTTELLPDSFDFVVCVAALHHMDADAALRRMRELVRPGGGLAVLGLAQSRYPADLARDIAATLVSRGYRLLRGKWESPAPIVLPPPHTYGEIRTLAERTLPGVRFRRHLLWRYSLNWTKPRVRGSSRG
jgi:ubiquinone/menaquinone biosynthesis C-methylase UbiE